MQLIQSFTLTSDGGTFLDLTSIPQTYTDLLVLLSIRTNRSGFFADDMHFRINGNSVNSAVRRLDGTGTALSSSTSDNPPIATAASATASTFSNVSVYIPNYTGTQNKTISMDAVTENNTATAYQVLHAAVLNTSSAVTSVGFLSTSSSTILTGTSISLYGIRKA